MNSKVPTINVTLTGQIDKELKSIPAVNVEENFLKKLKENRKIDSLTGRTNYGINRSDMKVLNQEKSEFSENCSTGEQKSLLVGIVLAIAKLQTEQRGFTPLLLLDEITAHLDEPRRASLFQLIIEMGAQAWITGTERDLFNLFNGQAQHLSIEKGGLIRK